MNLRNLLKPGDFVIPIPAGLPIQIEYGPTGTIKSIHRNDDCTNYTTSGNKVLSREFVTNFKNAKVAPVRIPVKEGTTFVSCILVPKTLSRRPEGMLLSTLGDDIINDVEHNHVADYTCYAYYAKSYAIDLRGAHPILQWLQMVKFNALRGYVMSVSTTDTDENNINRRMLSELSLDMTIPMMYGSYRGFEFSQYSCGIRHMKIQSVDSTYDASGTLWATAEDRFGVKLWINYSDMLKNPVYPSQEVVLDNLSNIVHIYPRSKVKKSTWSNVCPVCGAPIFTSGFDRSCCSNEHCTSKLYSKCTHFLKTLHLPGITYERFTSEMKDNKLFILSDIFQLPELSELQVQTTLSVLVSSVVGPINSNQYRSLCAFINRCNNNVTSMMYFLNNPDLLRARTDMYEPDLEVIIKWFEDAQNCAVFDSLINNPNIVLGTVLKKFEGAPIFRGNRILLTGDFIHGTTDEVESILNSYNATIVHEMSDAVSFIVVGSTMSNINGRWIQQAKQRNKPVYYESEFFQAYEIDKDLRENLL